jgi:hypothetical protein
VGEKVREIIDLLKAQGRRAVTTVTQMLKDLKRTVVGAFLKVKINDALKLLAGGDVKGVAARLQALTVEAVDEALDDEQKAVLKAVRKWAKKKLPGARIRTVSVKNPIFQLWMPGKTPTDPAIPNDIRLRIVKDVLGATPLDPENVRYGNVQGNSLNLRWDQWKKVMEIERQPVEDLDELKVPPAYRSKFDLKAAKEKRAARKRKEAQRESVDEATISTMKIGSGFLVILAATNADYYWTGEKWVTDRGKAEVYPTRGAANKEIANAQKKGRSQKVVEAKIEGETEKGDVYISTVPGYQAHLKGKHRAGYERTFKNRTIQGVRVVNHMGSDHKTGVVKLNDQWILVWLATPHSRQWSPLPATYVDTAAGAPKGDKSLVLPQPRGSLASIVTPGGGMSGMKRRRAKRIARLKKQKEMGESVDAFTAKITLPGNKARVKKSLSKSITYHGKTMTRAEAVRQAVKAGAKFAKHPTMGRALQLPDGEWVLSKTIGTTGVTYGAWLVKHGVDESTLTAPHPFDVETKKSGLPAGIRVPLIRYTRKWIKKVGAPDLDDYNEFTVKRTGDIIRVLMQKGLKKFQFVVNKDALREDAA